MLYLLIILSISIFIVNRTRNKKKDLTDKERFDRDLKEFLK